MIALLLAEVIYAHMQREAARPLWVGLVLISVSAAYFLAVVIGAIFLTSQSFNVQPLRLTRDAVISICFAVLAFSMFHRGAGIPLTTECETAFTPFDTLHYSAVTFSTLGDGDFRPCPSAMSRLMSAFEAIFSNLHLGLIVGAVFFFAQGAQPPVMRKQRIARRRSQRRNRQRSQKRQRS